MRRSTWTTRAIVALAVLVLLAAWQIASVVLDAPVILPTPVVTFESLGTLFHSPAFGANVLATVGRALRSFVIIFFCGVLLGCIAGYFPAVHAFLTPFLLLCKATPVMAVILLAFIWFSSSTVPLFSAFLMAFPVMFIQVERGFHEVPGELDEMTRLYGFTPLRRWFYLFIPSLVPSIITGAKTSLAMVWKVVIAAEVLTVPSHGVGARLQMAQVHLETAQVIAWTIIAVVLTAAGDAIFDVLLRFPPYIIRVRHQRILKASEKDRA